MYRNTHYTILLVLILITLYLTILLSKREHYTPESKTIDIVIARYKENLNWLNEIDLSQFRYVYVYDKGGNWQNTSANIKNVPLPNVGREPHTYLHHIIVNWDALADVTIFLPGSCDANHKWPVAKRTIEHALETRTSVFIAGQKYDNNKMPSDMYNFQLSDWQSSTDINRQSNAESVLSPAPYRPFGKWYDHYIGPTIPFRGVGYYGIFAVARDHIKHHNIEFYKNLKSQLNNTSNPEAGHYFERVWISIFNAAPNECII